MVRPAYQRNKLWWVRDQSNSADLAISELPIPEGGGRRLLSREDTSVPVLWTTNGDLNLTGATAAIDGTNILFYVENTTNPPRWQTASETHNNDGRDGTLVFCAREFATPILIPIRFAKTVGRVPIGSIGTPEWYRGRTWMLPTPAGLAIGHSLMDGFWFVPRPQLDAAINPRLAALRTAKAAIEGPIQERQKQLLAAYDKNRNGVLDPDEKQTMIFDSKYLRQNWPAIDANKNRLIDLSELDFFDADGNGLASDKEMEAIDKMLEIEVDDLFKEFDKNKDGGLSDDEMRALAKWIKANSTERGGTFADFGVPPQSDVNENGRLEPTRAAIAKKQ